MNTAPVSLSGGLAVQAAAMKAGDFGLQLSADILKQVLDAQKTQVDALVAMIENTAAAAAGVGTNLDRRI